MHYSALFDSRTFIHDTFLQDSINIRQLCRIYSFLYYLHCYIVLQDYIKNKLHLSNKDVRSMQFYSIKKMEENVLTQIRFYVQITVYDWLR